MRQAYPLRLDGIRQGLNARSRTTGSEKVFHVLSCRFCQILGHQDIDLLPVSAKVQQRQTHSLSIPELALHAVLQDITS